MKHLRFLLGLLVLLVGCGNSQGSGADLIVSVRSDLLPGFEFTEVRTTLEGASTESEVPALIRAGTAEHPSYLSGREVARFAAVSTSRPTVIVTLLAGEEVIAERRALASLSGGTTNALTVLVTRDCRTVSCPSVGDSPIATECVGGACVEEQCTPQTPMTCPVARCSRDSDCPEGVGCALPRCGDGRCFLAVDESLCGPGQRCDLDVGCLGDVAPTDAGVAEDAGTTDEDAGASAEDAGVAEDAGTAAEDAGP